MGKVIEMVSYENIPEYTGLDNTTSIEIKEGCEWNGHAYATCVGMVYDDGTIESYFKKDKEKGKTKENYQAFGNPFHCACRFDGDQPRAVYALQGGNTDGEKV